MKDVIKEITLSKFRKYFDMSNDDCSNKQKESYIEEVKYILKEVNCPNKNNTLIILKLKDYEIDDEINYEYKFYYQNKHIWSFSTDFPNKPLLIKEAIKLYNEWENRNQLTLW